MELQPQMKLIHHTGKIDCNNIAGMIMHLVMDFQGEYDKLVAGNAQLKVERDAAVEDLKKMSLYKPCEICGAEKNECSSRYNVNGCACFRWRGLEAYNETN